MKREHQPVLNVPGLSVAWWGPFCFGRGTSAWQAAPEITLRAYHTGEGVDIGMTVALTPQNARLIGTALVTAADAAEVAAELRETDDDLPILGGGK